ncbi:MAG: hypothetical protein HYR51_17720 [Candidatus Rokubacteria bacterium]|nr:hypothetical protein [Candidatus Rokubacteria bacterium]
MPGAHRSPWRLGGLSLRALAARVGERALADEILDRAAALSHYFLFALALSHRRHAAARRGDQRGDLPRAETARLSA